jgi:hypothetical protein
VHAAANGFVWLGATTDTTSNVIAGGGALVSQGPRLAPLWADLEPTWNLASHPDSGIYFDVDPGQQAVYVTWHKVALRTLLASGPSRISMQCVLRANGDFEYRYGEVALPSLLVGNGPLLVGWSQGNRLGATARLPAPTDLSSALPFATDGPDSTRLALDSTAPILGTSLMLTVSNVQNVVPIAFLMFGDTLLPGAPLASIGAPGCTSYTNGNLPWASFPVTLSGTMSGSGSLSVAVPDVPSLLGVTLTSQALAFTWNNALQLATSNGLDLRLGR